MSEEQESLLKFPCPISVKAMGKSTPGFDAVVADIVRQHVPYLGEGAVRSRSSSGGKYLAVTITFEAQSREQLDAIYHAFTADDRIIMSL